MSFQAAIQPFSQGDGFCEFPVDQRELVKSVKNEIKSCNGSSYIGQETGQCLSRIRIEKANFLSDLQEYAASVDKDSIEEIYKGNQQTRFNHLIEIRNNIGIYLPVFFFFPLRIAVKQSSLPVFVGSLDKLYQELQEINLHLNAYEEVSLGTIDDNFHASEEDLEDYEADNDGIQHFWPIFNYVVLEILVQKSLKAKLPLFVY